MSVVVAQSGCNKKANSAVELADLVPLDPVALFKCQCDVWASRYGAGRASLQQVGDLLEAMAPAELSADQAQRIIAAAITLVPKPERPSLEYIPLVANNGVPSAEELQRVYERTIERRRAQYGPAVSTLGAAEYLQKQDDPDRFRRWLAEHSPRERAAICAHLARKGQSNANNG
jgi:hypothetical protein